MTLTTDTQQIERILNGLRKPWTVAAPLNEVLDQLSELLYSMAHDRADARELCDQRAILLDQQGRILKSMIEQVAVLDRRIKTALDVIDLPAIEQAKLDAIKEILLCD